MNRDFKMPFSSKMMRSLVASLFLLLVAELSTFVLADYDNKTWDISYQYSGAIVAPRELPVGKAHFPVYVTASGWVTVTSPTGVDYVVSRSNIDMSADGFWDFFFLGEVGEYQIKETYILTFSRWDYDSESYIPEPREESHVWPQPYVNSAPSIVLFRLEDMYIHNYEPDMTPNGVLEIFDIDPPLCRPGGKVGESNEVGEIVVTIEALRDIEAGENIDVSASFSAEWYKTSLLTSTTVAEKAVHLYPGWNLISICLDTGNTDPLSVLESIEGLYSSVWTYSAGNWQRYIYGGLDSLNDLKTIVPGKGYWIDMDVEATLTITGVQIIADDDRAIRLSQGWNLAGYNSLNSQLRSNAQLPPEYTSIWTYNNSITDGTWLGHVIGADFFNDLDQLEVGRGHWIYVLANCFWVIPR